MNARLASLLVLIFSAEVAFAGMDLRASARVLLPDGTRETCSVPLAPLPEDQFAGMLIFKKQGALEVGVRSSQEANGVTRLKVLVTAAKGSWNGARLERISLEMPLQLEFRKRVVQPGASGLLWETRSFYQFHTEENANRLMKEPDTNKWSVFRSDWLWGDTYTLARWESARTAPFVMNRGRGFPGWLALFDRKTGVAIGWDEPVFRVPMALEARTEGGGSLVADLHPASTAPVLLEEDFKESAALKIRAFSGEPLGIGQLLARKIPLLPAVQTEGAEPSNLLPVFGGVPFSAGALKPGETLSLQNSEGRIVPLQTAPLGYWPDGSVKWLELVFPRNQSSVPKSGSLFQRLLSAVSDRQAVVVHDFDVSYGSGSKERFTLLKDDPAKPVNAVTVELSGQEVHIGNGRLSATFETGTNWWKSLRVDGKQFFAEKSTPQIYLDTVESDAGVEPGSLIPAKAARTTSLWTVDKIEMEENGPVRAVMKLEGRITGPAASRMILRLEFYADSTAIRGFHTFVVGNFDPRRTFISGMGLELPLVLKECGAVADRGQRISLRQGERFSLGAFHPEIVETVLESAGKENRLQAKSGEGGALSLEDEERSLSVLLRDFRQMFPMELAGSFEKGKTLVEIGFWPRSAGIMDLRRYSDFPHAAQGETITTETNDWVEKVYYATEPVRGISRTHEFLIVPETGKPTELPTLLAALDDRPLIYSGKDAYRQAGVLMDALAVPGSEDAENNMERFADFLEFHRQRWGWYGKWNYGDIQHRFHGGYGQIVPPEILGKLLVDGTREVPKRTCLKDYQPQQDWASDNGRWGWTNTEGMPNRFLGELYLRTGRRDIFFFMEALARQSRDVVIRHEGRWFGSGTRHGVQPWSDGGHQSRQTIASEYRLHRLLSGDKRSRDVLLKLGYEVYLKPKSRSIQGTSPLLRDHVDHSARLYGLLTLWEATGDPAIGDALARYVHLFVTPEGIATQPTVRFPEIIQASAPASVNSGSMFFNSFGGMHTLVEYYNLTRSEELRKGICRMAAFALNNPENLKTLDSGELNSANFYWLAIAFAARHADDPKLFRDFLRKWLAGPGAGAARQIVTRNSRHWTGTTAFLHTNMAEILFWMNVLPYVVESAGRLDAAQPARQAEIDQREAKGVPKTRLPLSWQNEYDHPEFRSYLGH